MHKKVDRNTTSGFSGRVRKNFKYLHNAQAKGEDVHIVTALIVSLLGLIVFPFEDSKDTIRRELKTYHLDSLTKDGWPNWQFEICHSETLDNLVWHLRNAISHRRIVFSCDCRILDNVQITFSDRGKDDESDTWRATINGADLLTFVERFSKLIDER